MEMKFRNKYYETKILEKYKYDQMMALPNDVVKLYFVDDPKANYLFWLNNLTTPEVKEIECPSTCLLYTSPSPRDRQKSRMPSSA